MIYSSIMCLTEMLERKWWGIRLDEIYHTVTEILLHTHVQFIRKRQEAGLYDWHRMELIRGMLILSDNAMVLRCLMTGFLFNWFPERFCNILKSFNCFCVFISVLWRTWILTTPIYCTCLHNCFGMHSLNTLMLLSWLDLSIPCPILSMVLQ